MDVKNEPSGEDAHGLLGALCAPPSPDGRRRSVRTRTALLSPWKEATVRDEWSALGSPQPLLAQQEMEVWPGGVGVGEPVQRAMDKNLVRVDMAALRAHGRAGGRLHGEWGRDPQIRAIGEELGVDIVILRTPGEFGAVDYYECGGAHALGPLPRGATTCCRGCTRSS